MSIVVSCLCVTEDRPAFMPWLLWAFDRQDWPERELVIVDSSKTPLRLPQRRDVRVIRAQPGTSVGAKRNVALAEARGRVIAWFDDDDWQHPRRLREIVEALEDSAAYVGQGGGWFVDLASGRCAPYRPKGRVLFNVAGFRTEVARSVPFDASVRRASDSAWLRALASKYRGKWGLLPGDDAFFWLCHERNISNPASRRRFPHDLDRIRKHLGEAWLDTDQQLDALRERLRQPADAWQPQTIVVGAARALDTGAREHGTGSASHLSSLEPAGMSTGPSSGRGTESADRISSHPSPLVAAVIKATALDVPFLRATVPHMLRQAGVPFAERLLSIDRRETFTGKYRTRSRGTETELDRVIEDLLQAGVVDRVVDVDESLTRQREILERYFGEHAARVPTHTRIGCPIYATLFGIEAAPVDHVVQFDADMLFHASGGSWVEAGLVVLRADPTIWLVMTHAGPPAGPMGSAESLGPRNARRARWDPTLRVWRFVTASTRYFLTDRQRLHGKLAPVAMAGGCAPLEVCVGAALKRHGASRVSLAIEGSWDLHPASHEAPFPAWVDAIAAAVERGDVPERQRGDYDLRLDRHPDRARWRRVVSEDAAWSVPEGLPKSEVQAIPSAPPSAPGRVAPLAVVISVRDRAGARLRRCLAALAWQSTGRPLQTLVVSHGSQPRIDAELATICDDTGATLIRIGEPADPWRKPLALNVGLRATDPALAFVMTLDADMILAPDFLEVVLQTLREEPRRLVLCQSSDLPQRAELPEPAALLEAYPRLKACSRLRGRHGTGGIQAAPRSFFFDVRGYDEDLVWWGAEDGDMVRRAELAGLERVWICDRTSMLHQWHPRTLRVLTQPLRREAANASRRNHQLVAQRADQMRRNPAGWGFPERVTSARQVPTQSGHFEMPRIVIGLGTGRCGTKSLAALLDAQPGFAVTHEARPVLRWDERTAEVVAKVSSLTKRGARVVGDVCHSYVPHVEMILERFSSAVAICLQRDKTETIESYVRKTQGHNLWGIGRAPGRNHAFWRQRFPTYPTANVREALAMYWDEYYARAEVVASRFPDRFRVFPTEALNTEEGVRRLLEFVGQRDGEMVVGVHLNRSRSPKDDAGHTPGATCRHKANGSRDAARVLRRVRAVLSPRRCPRNAASGPIGMEPVQALRARYCADVSTDGRALSLPAIRLIARTIHEHGLTSVLDLGSGFGSAALRHLQRSNALPSLRTVVSVDDDPAWLEATRRFCRQAGLDEHGFRRWDEKLQPQTHDFVIYDLGDMETRSRHAAAVVDLARRPGFVYYDDLHKPGYAEVVERSVRGRRVIFYDVAAQTLDDFGRFGLLARLEATRSQPVRERQAAPRSVRRGPIARRSAKKERATDQRRVTKRLTDRAAFDREVWAYGYLDGVEVVPRMLRAAPPSLVIELEHRGTPLEALSSDHHPSVETVVDALAAIHARGLAHGDLHAGSVLIDGRGRVALVDFAFASEQSVSLAESPDLNTPELGVLSVGRTRWDDDDPRSLRSTYGVSATQAIDRYVAELRCRIAHTREEQTRSVDVPFEHPRLSIEAPRTELHPISRLGLEGLVAGRGVVVLGCGLGTLCLRCVQAGATSVVGIEPEASRVRLASRIASVVGLHRHVRFHRHPAEALGSAGSNFDVVLAPDFDALGRDPVSTLCHLAPAARTLIVATQSDTTVEHLRTRLGFRVEELGRIDGHGRVVLAERAP